MKKLSTQFLMKNLSIFLILLLITSAGLAQRIPFPPTGRIPENWHIYTPSSYNFSFLKNKKKHEFTIVLSNDSTIRLDYSANNIELSYVCNQPDFRINSILL
jgi:hypothetical protein